MERSMHRPVLVTPPTVDVVTLEEAKLHLRVDVDEDDELIKGLIAAAVGHLEGWPGLLGRVLAEQNWRKAFDWFARCMILPPGPVFLIARLPCRRAEAVVRPVD